MATDSQLTRQAQGLLAQRRHKDAAALCIEGLSQAPNDPELLVILALCDEAQGDSAGAIDRLQAAMAADGRHQGACFQLGRLEAARGQFQRARELFDQCLALNPNHVGARTLRARLDAAAGNRQAAIAGLKSALRADERHLPALTTLADLLVDEGQLEQAHEQASRALRLNPNSAAVQMSMAKVLIAQGHPAFALQCLENAAQSAPNDPRPRMALAGLLQSQGEHAKALAVLEELAELGYQGTDRLLAEARSLRRVGRLVEALQRYEVLVEPADAATRLLLEATECCVEGGYPEVAEELLARPALQGAPQALLLQAQLYERAGDLARADELAASLHQSSEPSVSTAARLMSTRLALLANDAERAQTELQPLLDSGEAVPSVVWLAAEVAQSRDEHDRAIGLLEQLLERKRLDEDSRAKTHGMLVQVLDRADRHAEAAAHLSAAASRTPFVGYGLRENVEGDDDTAAIDPWRWATETADDGRVRPVFMTGWPGTGRELLFAALAASSKLAVLAPGSWRVRRSGLSLPADFEKAASLDQAEASLQRRRYLRQLNDSTGQIEGLLEGGMVVAEDLPMLARIFPGATLIVPSASQADLEMHWKLNGFRDLPAMLATWQRDQRLLEKLGKLLPLKRVEVSLQGLFEEPVSSFRALCNRLELESEPAMLEAMDRARLEHGYRAPGHWQHYQWTV